MFQFKKVKEFWVGARRLPLRVTSTLVTPLRSVTGL